MKEEKTEGIVLRSFPYRENERILTVFTQDSGLISLIVKRLSSSLLSLASPFCRSEFIYRKGKTDLFRFLDGTPIDYHLFLRDKLSHLDSASALAQGILSSQMPLKPAPALYALLLSYLKHLPQFAQPAPLLSSFYLKTLLHEGLFSTDHTPFSTEEEQVVHELILCKQFLELEKCAVSPELADKIHRFFKEKISQDH
jgi:DNA repair protein RecO (recombination protein O)